MATTSYAVGDAETVKLWSKKLMREALKETYVSRFMGTSKDSLVYVKNELNKSAGDRVRCALRMQLSGNGISGDGTLEGNEEALTTYTDDLLIDQLRHAVRSDGEMTEQRVPFSIREEAKDGLRDWWADRMDTAFFNQITGNTTVTALFAGMNAPTAPTGTAASNGHFVYGSSTTSTTGSITATDTAGAIAAGFVLDPAAIDMCVNLAKIASPLIRPIKVNGQNKYVMFIHPNQTRMLRQNNAANTVSWFDIQRARVEGGEMDNPIYNGALGEYNGVILHESNRVPAPAASGNSNFRRAVLCGAQAAVFATGQRDQDQQMKWVEELFDYENQLGVSAAMIWGMKKTLYNGIDFGTIVCQTYAPNPQ